MNELECMTNYSLVPIDSVVCSSGSDWSTWTQWSALYVNEIQHNSAWIVNITIPEEFNWDYTWNDEQFDLVISWYNVDTDYIAWIIENQTTLPNDIDFNNIVSVLLPLFVPWVVIILFIYVVFKLLKKVF